MRHRLISLLLFCSLFLSVSACSLGSGVTDIGKNVKPIEIAAMPNDFNYSAVTGFAANLFSKAAATGDENITLSPLSAYIALSMAAVGAKGDTARAFSEVLGLDCTELNTACRALMENYSELSGSTELTLSSSAWSDPSVTLKDSYMQDLKDYYSASIYSAELDNKKLVKAVNQWASDNTNGMIDHFLKEPLSPDAAILLLNAIYMDAKWKEPFESSKTAKQWFLLENGSRASVDFLHSDVTTHRYILTKDTEGILLPYDDGRLVYLALRPTDGKSISKFASDFTADTLSTYMNGAYDENVRLSMPVLSMEYSGDLSSTLESLGLDIAFDSIRADFTGMADPMDGNLFINKVIQSVRVDVNEDGTKAAAVTSVELDKSSAPAEGFVELNLNSPFVWAVVDSKTGIPLFIGVVNNPMTGS